MDIRFLGHPAFELSDGDTRVLIDPFLTGNPKAAADPGELEPTTILLTHGHVDHLGDTVDIAKRTGAPVVAMVELAQEIGEEGVDVFDPSTGVVRTGGTDDIACWFIDSDYDGQSFFVRQAYFLYGGKETAEGPYDKLKKALRAEIDEGEWGKLYSATSQPFDPPKSGKIAVKVINHYGDEVLKVYAIPK